MSHIEQIETKDPQSAGTLGQYWFDHYAPKNLLASENNVLKMGQHIRTHFNGVFSITHFNATLSALAQELEYKGQVVQEKIVEVERKQSSAELAEEKRRKQDLAGIPRKAREWDSKPSGRVNHADAQGKERTNNVSEIRDTIVEQRQKESDQMMLDRAKARCEGFSNSRNHSKNFDARKALLAKFNAMVAAGKSPQEVAQGIDAAIRQIPEPGAPSVRGV